MSRLLQALHSGRVLLMDGAMGTELQRRGLKEGEPPELWNLTHPDEVRAVHRAYVDAGAEVLVTNTFQAYQGALSHYWAEHRLDDGFAMDRLGTVRGLRECLDEIWQAATTHVRLFHGRQPILLASLGPIRWRISMRQIRPMLEVYRATDALLLETQTLAHANGCLLVDHNLGLPVLFSFTYDKSSPPTEMALMAKKCAALANRDGAAALGANCGKEIDMEDLLQIVGAYRQKTDLPIFIRPNAGTPTRTAKGWEYPRSPEHMADKLWPLLEAGVTMVGGCCGTTPAHIAAFRKVIDEWNAPRS